MTNADANSWNTTDGDWSELASRENDGLSISLFWSPSTNGIKVRVADANSDDAFDFGVAGSDALSAFHHPFAYAPTKSRHWTGRARLGCFRLTSPDVRHRRQ